MARKPQGGGRSPTVEIGTTGLTKHGSMGHGEFLRQLQGRRAARTYREMSENSPVIGGMLFAIEMLARQVDWTVEPFEATEQDEATAQFVEECLHDMSSSWEDTLAEILSFLVYGWSYHEVVYKQRLGPDETDPATRSQYTDGRWGWRKMAQRPQHTLDRWEVDDRGGIQGMWQASTRGPSVLIPIERALLFRTTTRGNNPEGKSILRNAYRPWYYETKIADIEAVGIERELAGLPYAEVPARIMDPSAGAEDRAAYDAVKKIVRDIRFDELAGVVFPQEVDDNGNKLYELKLLSTAGGRAIQPDVAINRYARWQTMVVLADFIMLGHEKVGSLALSSDKTDLFAVAIGTFLDTVAGVVNRHGIPKLLGINGLPQDRRPTLQHGDITTDDVAKIATAMKDFALAGFDMTDLQNDVRRRTGYPERPEDELDGSLTPADRNAPKAAPGGQDPEEDGSGAPGR